MQQVKFNIHLSFVLVIMFFSFGTNFFEPIKASSFETETTVIPSIGTVGTGDMLNFTVWVYSEWDPVAGGIVRITDLNTSTSYEKNLNEGKAEFYWSIGTSYLAGDHVFLTEYLGFGEYLPSVGNCTVYFGEVDEGTYRETSTVLAGNSSVVYKNASVRFDIEVKIPYSWFFDGGFIYIRNINLSGSNNIHTYGPLPYKSGSDPTVFTYSFIYQIPVFTPIGINFFVAEYTGSTDSMTMGSTSVLLAVTVKSTGFTLSQKLNESIVQRDEETLGIETTILGDYPKGLELRSYYLSSGQRVYFSNRIVEGRVVNTTFYPNNTVQVGNLSLITELIDPSTEKQYANITKYVDIIDWGRIDETLNSTEYRHNDTIEFSIYITEEDVYTRPVECTVELIDITDGNISITNKTTNQDGFVVINYRISTNSTVGQHLYELRTHNTPKYILDVSKVVSVNIRGLTEIDVTYESSAILRGEYTPIQVTVLSGSNPINEGTVSLQFKNGTIIETKACEPGVVFQYYIKLNHPLGSVTYQIYYSGTSNYDSHIKQFDLTIFSRPSFNYTRTNASEVVKGEYVRIWGQLLDETGSYVSFEEIVITDTTVGVVLGTTTTNAEGIFYYDYYISESSQIGLHFVEARYDGNVLKFLYSSEDRPTVSFTVRPPLSILIDSEILSESYTMIRLSGGLNDEVNISWQKEGETMWGYIGTVVLNSSGYGEYNWTTPYYKGRLTIRAEGPNDTKYDSSDMYVIPKIILTSPNEGDVNTEFRFTVECNERYQIWIQGQLWNDWVEGGVHDYVYIFESTGIKEIKIVSDDAYVYHNERVIQTRIYEELSVVISVPSETYVNLTTNIDGTILGEISGPIQGIDIILEINGTKIQIDSSDNAGNYYFNPTFSHPGNYVVQVKTNTSEDRYYRGTESTLEIIVVKSIPANVIIQSPVNETYGGVVEISFDGNAREYRYWIQPVDSINISWTENSYRQLTEGNYVIHVYGVNDYDVISYVNSTFTVDTTSPTVVLMSPLNESYTRDDIALEYLNDEGTLTAYLDGQIIHNVYSGMYLMDLAEGMHNLTLRVEDLVGNYMITRAYFEVDTIFPSLVVNSPRNQSYTGEVLVSISSNATTLLYYIEGIHAYNETYTDFLYLNLSYNNYRMHIYAFDEAGNVVHETIEFSVVKSIVLLVDTSVEELDNTGKYLVSTGIINHPDFNVTGVIVNGTNIGLLEWDSLAQKYKLEIQLGHPGRWEITIFAKTKSEEYDFVTFIVVWDSPEARLERVNIAWDEFEEVYIVQIMFVDDTVPIDSVKIIVNGSIFDLSYESFWDRWVVNLAIRPANYTFYIETWYKWDNEQPSTHFEYAVSWFAPSIKITSMEPSRSEFNLELRIERENVTIDTESVLLVLYNGSTLINVSGILVFESLLGDYQDWAFNTPNLVPSCWNYTIYVSDSEGMKRAITGIYNNSDSPPEIIAFSFKHRREYDTDTTQYWELFLQVVDDYAISRIRVLINGVEFSGTPYFNGSHYIFTFYLGQGVHTFTVSVIDDINQITEEILETIRVNVTPTSTMSDSSKEENSTVNSKMDNPSIIRKNYEPVLFMGFALILVAGVVIFKKKK